MTWFAAGGALLRFFARCAAASEEKDQRLVDFLPAVDQLSCDLNAFVEIFHVVLRWLRTHHLEDGHAAENVRRVGKYAVARRLVARCGVINFWC